MTAAQVLSDEVKMSVVRVRALAKLARHLRVSAVEYGNSYASFRRAVEA